MHSIITEETLSKFTQHSECRADAGLRKQGTCITVGTDCSGLDTPILALRNLRINFRHVFSSNRDPQAQASIMHNCAPERFYEDLTQRDQAAVGHVDLYVAGFPCQPFSAAGKQQGFRDAAGRGTIFFHIYEYITLNLPTVFILENVKGITTIQNGVYHRQILDMLTNIEGDDPATSRTSCSYV